jgi:hypothetical protein
MQEKTSMAFLSILAMTVLLFYASIEVDFARRYYYSLLALAVGINFIRMNQTDEGYDSEREDS